MGRTSRSFKGMWNYVCLSFPGVVVTAIPPTGLPDSRFLHMASPAQLSLQRHLLVVSSYYWVRCGRNWVPGGITEQGWLDSLALAGSQPMRRTTLTQNQAGGARWPGQAIHLGEGKLWSQTFVYRSNSRVGQTHQPRTTANLQGKNLNQKSRVGLLRWLDANFCILSAIPAAEPMPNVLLSSPLEHINKAERGVLHLPRHVPWRWSFSAAE